MKIFNTAVKHRSVFTNCWRLIVTIIHLGFGLGGVAWSDTYEVGPSKSLKSPLEVPWEDLLPGDEVLIYGRAEPYQAKWVIGASGTAERPIIVKGVPVKDPLTGRLEQAVIEGNGAKSRPELRYDGQDRAVLRIGSAHVPDAPEGPRHVIVEGLTFRGARKTNTFVNTMGEEQRYDPFASAIHIQSGADIRLIGCKLEDSGNGLVTSHASSDIFVKGCTIWLNGNPASISEHNVYTESRGITFFGNRIGPLADGASGNSLKDRSTNLRIVANTIKGGSRVLDLVDSEYHMQIPEGSNLDQTASTETLDDDVWVVGNILVKLQNSANNQVVHFGGDSTQLQFYRREPMYFINNTVLSMQSGQTTLFRSSSSLQKIFLFNNIFTLSDFKRSRYYLLYGEGSIEYGINFMPYGWLPISGPILGRVNRNGAEKMLEGDRPGFNKLDDQYFSLLDSSMCKGVASKSVMDKLPAEVHELLNEAKLLPMADLGAPSLEGTVPGP